MPISVYPPYRLVAEKEDYQISHDIPTDHGRLMDASTECNAQFEWEGQDVNIKVDFVSQKIRAGATMTDDLLKHEQGHADICFLAAVATGWEITKHPKRGKQIISEHQRRTKVLERLYDRETVHGTNQAHQKKWNQILDNAIKFAPMRRHVNLSGHRL